jgi:hypothetical protein
VARFFNLDLTDAITITDENRYLHFYHFRENLNKGFSVNINKDTPWEDADKGTKRFDMDLANAGTWEDVVVDLKWFMDNSEPLSRICVLMDRNWVERPNRPQTIILMRSVCRAAVCPAVSTSYPTPR